MNDRFADECRRSRAARRTRQSAATNHAREGDSMGRETHGKVEQIKGRAKEAAGILTGNRELENEGAKQRAAGSVEEGIGKARRQVGDALASVAKAIKK
jgi:uncharacterized protein YjbJ (UPF0337 family)